MGPETKEKIARTVMLGAPIALTLLLVAANFDYRSQTPKPDSGDTCCVPGAEPRRAPGARVPADLAGGSTESGRMIYIAACANCHDNDGSGTDGRRTFAEILDIRTSTNAATVIVHGRGRMPAFGGLLADGEIRDLLAYVKTLD